MSVDTNYTLAQLLQYRAVHNSKKTAFIFKEKDEISKITYEEIANEAQCIASQLKRLCNGGKRALLLFPPGLDFIKGFFGSIYAGLIAVPAYPPGNNRNAARIQAIIKNANPTICLSTLAVKKRLKSLTLHFPEILNLQWLFLDQITRDCDTYEINDAITSNDIAILQYTSGSTNLPKGVMVSHKNFLHNLGCSYKKWELSEKSVMVSWLPVFHDMGLVGGILLPIFGGFCGILMSPTSFLQHPYRWLQAISMHKGTISLAPNFAYQLCADKISKEEIKTLDLSSWTQAINGAEPVKFTTLQHFSKIFQECGFNPLSFNPGYGLAEGTLVVSVGEKERPYTAISVSNELLSKNIVQEVGPKSFQARTLVSCGQGHKDQRIVIVNPKIRKPCPEREIGEIWVMGPSIAQGYWNRQEETKNIFKAYLAPSGEGPFLRTGDLGFLHQGDLYITGRQKDLIIFHGQNYYPEDIESSVVESSSAFRKGCTAAFSIPFADEDRLVVVQEIKRHSKWNLADLVQTVRTTIIEDFGIQLYKLILIRSHSIPKTSSGKIQRQATKRSYEKGELAILGEWEAKTFTDRSDSIEDLAGSQKEMEGDPASERWIRNWLITLLAATLNLKENEIDPNKPLSLYGLDSVSSVTFSGEVGKKMKQTMPASLVFDYPTINALTAYLIKDDLNEKKLIQKQNASETQLIAIIGMACNFPKASNTEQYWNLIIGGGQAITEFPETRWNCSIYKSLSKKKEKAAWKRGGFIDNYDLFDSTFFEISSREAKSMDPQQRLLLKTVWRALENACQGPKQYGSSKTGVFIGISSFDHALLELGNTNDIDAYGGTGISHSIAANRISYYFNFQGPSLAVDTACSSSLVAVHLACQSLRNGESDMAIAGGVNLILSPSVSITLNKAGMLAKDGRCKTFDSKADGYVRGEGCGIIVLKRLPDAIANSDRILAVIRGTAVNQDGRSNGLTAPNGPSQESVIQQALKNANIQPHELDYVECHGTGTSLGDPQEVQALNNVLGKGRRKEQICTIGSVKTNIGHLEAAAGIAGLIKVILSLNHQLIPPHLNLKEINPHIPLTSTPFLIPTKTQEWPFRESHPRRAGISSFGFGGTNAHVIVEEAPLLPIEKFEEDRKWHILTISAKDQDALKKVAQSYLKFLESSSLPALSNVCFSTNTGRGHFNHRLAVTAESFGQLREGLEKFVQGQLSPSAHIGEVTHATSNKMVWMFSCQGIQYSHMADNLYNTCTVFKNSLDRCAIILGDYLDRSLNSILYPENQSEAELINQTKYGEPALFSIEFALAETLQSWGIRPDVVLGHGLGEYVAACIAGIVTLEDALLLVAERGRLVESLPKNGKMISIFSHPTAISELIGPYRDTISIAAVNAPNHVVISGSISEIDRVLALLREKSIHYRELKVSHTLHSNSMEPILEEFHHIASAIHFKDPEIPMISSLTGSWIGTNLVMNGEYLKKHLRNCVQFGQSIQTCFDSGINTFIELGPDRTLLHFAEAYKPPSDASHISMFHYTLAREINPWNTLNCILAKLFCRGVSIDWDGYHQGTTRKRLSLPGYPFQPKRFPLLRKGIFSEIPNAESDLIQFLITESDHAQNKIPQDSLEACQSYLDILDKLSLAYQHKTLKTMGILSSSMQEKAIHDCLKNGMVLPQFKKLIFRWLHNFKFQPSPSAKHLEITNPRQNTDTEEIIQNLLNLGKKEPGMAMFFELANCFGKNLPELLSGKLDALEVFFRDGSMELPENLYQHSTLGRYYNGILQNLLIKILSRIDYRESKIKILEIGAGTGATSSFLIPVCPQNNSTYIFSDIGDVFLNRAKQKFQQFSNVSYQLVDIEKNPQDQNLECGSFDVIIASNVLHATRNIKTTIANVDRLLAPGGILMIWEVTSPLNLYDISFVFLEGWQRFENDGFRKDHPMLSKERWLALLQKFNFINTAAFPLDESNNFDFSQHILLAQKPIVRSTEKNIPSTFVSESSDKEDKDLRAPTDGQLKGLFFESTWVQEDLRVTMQENPSHTNSTWIIFADHKRVANNLAASLEKLSDQVFLVFLGENYSSNGQDIRVNPKDLKQITSLLSSLVGSCHHRNINILYFWSLDTEIPGSTDLNAIENLLRQEYEGIIKGICPFLKKFRNTFPSRFWIITSGAQSVGEYSSPRSSGSATLWGLGRVVALEYPEQWGGLIDLDPMVSNQTTELLLKEILYGDEEDQIAFRSHKRFVLRLHPKTFPEEHESPIVSIKCRPDGTYIISGGLGGLGYLSARWLASIGARRLLLLGKNEVPLRNQWKLVREGSVLANKIERIRELESLGISVLTANFDIGDPNEFKTFFTLFDNDDWPPVRGIIHAAGTTGDCRIDKLEMENFNRVVRSKVIGGWLLRNLYTKYPLDFFITFSSAASILVSSGGASYAMANAYLDSLAHETMGSNCHNLCINWGPIETVGLAEKENRVAKLAVRGITSLKPEQARHALNELSQSTCHQSMVISADWKQFLETLPEDSPPPRVLAEMGGLQGQIEERNEKIQKKSNDPLQPGTDSSPNLSENTSPQKIKSFIIIQVSHLLMEPESGLRHDTPLQQQGLDSIMAVQLANELELHFNVKIPMKEIPQASVNSLTSQVVEFLQLNSQK